MDTSCCEYAGTLFSKENHERNQINEANDLSITVDEAPQKDEYDGDPTYEDLVEQEEEQKERASSPFQHSDFL